MIKNIEKIYYVNNGEYSENNIRKYPYINVASGKESYQNCYLMKAYESLEEARENLEADSIEFYKRYGKCSWYICEAYGHKATIDNPYYDITENKHNAIKEISQQLEKATNEFLENDYEGNIPDMIIKYNGKSVSIPLDYAELNNEVQEMLSNLAEIMLIYGL